ncbi:hypothetical protein MTO96_017642 [Rhipicephalus appendiculatus]
MILFHLPGGSKDDVMRDTSGLTAVVLGVIIALGVIAVALAVIALTSGSNIHDTTVGTEEQPEITEHARDAGQWPDRDRAGPPRRPAWKLSALPPSPRTPLTTTLPTTTQTPKKNDSWINENTQLRLLCTVGAKLDAPETLPPDDLCGFLFYDSVYKKGPTPSDPGHLDSTLGIFVGGRPGYIHTQFGIGFAYKYREYLKTQLATKEGATPAVVQHFSSTTEFAALAF